MQQATLIGGSGFIGRYLCQALAQRGWHIRIACRHPSRAQALKALGRPGQIQLVRAPLGDLDKLAQAMEGAELVVNLVGILFETKTQRFEELQAQAPGQIGALAAQAGVRDLLHLSALGANLQSQALYARTKAQGETNVLAAFPNTRIFRPSLVIGAEDGFFNRFASMAMISPALPLVGGGQSKFQPLIVQDLVAAMLAALDQPATRGKTFELGGPKIYSFKELLELMLETMNIKRLLLPLPWFVANIQASILERLPNPPLTRDQVKLLRHDNIVSGSLPGFANLGLEPQAIEASVKQTLAAYRRRG